MQTKYSNMIVVDWGSVMFERSFDQNRIKGDTAAHYGIEGRMLDAQMILQGLLSPSTSSSRS